MVAQQLEGQADQVVKIDALVGGQAFFIVRHDAGDDAFVVVLGLHSGARGVQSFAFPGADDPLPLARGGGIHRAAGVFQDAGDVVAVQDGKIGLESQCFAILTQHAHPQGVKSADHHFSGRAADQTFRAFAHFGGGLVRERDGGDALGLESGLNQAANLVRDDPRLARASACEHQAGPVHVVDSFLLGQIQAMGRGRGHAV